jgi:hypothetical protein
MYRPRLFCALGVGLCSTWLAASQAAPPSGLSQELRTHLQNERFQIVSSVRGLPLGVRTELQTLFGSLTLDIAEPGAAFQSDGATTDANPPSRRMVAAGCSYEHCLVYYERGGAPRTWRMALFHWRPDATRLELGGLAPGGLTTIEDLRRAILSGAVKSSSGPW